MDKEGSTWAVRALTVAGRHLMQPDQFGDFIQGLHVV